MSTRHAVVIGGSIAGLCAARVLADAFAHVTVIDRDSLPATIGERAGVPQGRHVHALLERGRRDLDRLFPGFVRLMLERGACDLDVGWELAALRQFGWQPRARSAFSALFASRSLLEATVRELLRRIPNVELLERTAVTGLLIEGDGHPLARGVAVQARDGGASGEVAADLVVDASGSASKAPEWLRTLGIEPPAETMVDSFAGYSTRWYQAPAPADWPPEWWWKGIWIDPLPPDHLTAGVLFPVEDGRWIVTLAGISRHYPPADEAGFTEAVRRLRSPILADALALAEPLSPVYCNRAMENRFRHYESWTGNLGGFVALGDAACKFNPVYGQGMTVAAVSAGILAECLREMGPASPGLPTHFFRRQARFLAEPWGLAIGADFRFEGTAGPRPPGIALLNSYFDALFQASFADAGVRDTIVEVFHLLAPSAALFGPAIVARVGIDVVRRRLAGGAPTVAVPPAPGL